MTNDPLVAHVYRDQKIICTVIIEQEGEGYTAYPEQWPNRHLAQSTSLDHITGLIDHYLEGFADGYDAGKEAEDADRRLAASDWAARKAREAKRKLRVSDRGPAFPS